jgi:lactate dehydrogenase-like 2-hydroxyacid dehydrogenase
MADWSGLDKRATTTVFNDHLADPDAVVARLQSFDIACVMHERTPMTRAVIERLPRLRLIASTALRNASIDLEATAERGVEVMHTGYSSTSTIEPTWALILASARQLVAETPRYAPAAGSALSATSSPAARLACWASAMSAVLWRGSARLSAWR